MIELGGFLVFTAGLSTAGVGILLIIFSVSSKLSRDDLFHALSSGVCLILIGIVAAFLGFGVVIASKA